MHRSLRRDAGRAGFTIIEMLVAVAITMIMMLAIVQIFALMSENMRNGRAIIEMSGQLRNVAHRLQQDLDGLTCSTRPWTMPDAGDGYFEYIEGPARDADHDADGTANVDDFDSDGDATADVEMEMWGDTDDILMFTARSTDRPFVGRFDGDPDGIIESDLAEIIWWIHWEDTNGDTMRQPEEVSLHRRVLLIRPDLHAANAPAGTLITGISFSPIASNPPQPQTFFNHNDVSARLVPNASDPTKLNLVANSLADLTLRQNRFAHTTLRSQADEESRRLHLFPYAVIPRPVSVGDPSDPSFSTTVPELGPLTDNALGLDVVLNKVVAFDVRVYDPLAPLTKPTGAKATLVPGDAGVNPAILGEHDDLANPADYPNFNLRGRGAYVDLGYAAVSSTPHATPRLVSFYSGLPNFKSQLHAVADPLGNAVATYSTWPFHYEQDGLSQDNDDGDGAVADGGFASIATVGITDRDINNDGRIDFQDAAPFNDVPDAGESSDDATLLNVDVNGNSQNPDVTDVYDADDLKDEGTDGFNQVVDLYDNTTNPPTLGGDGNDDNPLADDPGEYETFPPYPHPLPKRKAPALRGIQVRIRIADPQTRQVRQATVVGNFVPE